MKYNGYISDLYRKRLDAEKGAVLKKWGGNISIALVFPHYYYQAMSNLGFQYVYSLLNDTSNIVAERAFLPEKQELSLYVKTGTPLASLESLTPLKHFDIIAFSVSFEQDYLNILNILSLAQIPLLTSERNASHPVLLAGGIAISLNPEPIASIIDLFLPGEGEVTLPPFIDFLTDNPDFTLREDFLLRAARSLPFIYVPSLYKQTYNKNNVFLNTTPCYDGIPDKILVPRAKLDSYQIPTSRILTSDTEFSDRILIETARGCTGSCRFCAAGHAYRPYRFQSKKKINETIHEAIKSKTAVGIIAPNVSDVPYIESLLENIIDMGGSFSLSSLRADTLTYNMLELLKKSGQKTVTIAPEAGSERLRRVINKHLTEKQILNAVEMISLSGYFSVRLYFMLGLPTETDEDIESIVMLIKKIRGIIIAKSAPKGRIGGISITVSCFVPKAWTPFQWSQFENIKKLKEKQSFLRKSVNSIGGIKIRFESPSDALVQAVLARGDRRTAELLISAYKNGGNWVKALREADPSNINILNTYKRHCLDVTFPWEILDHGINREYLREEYDMAINNIESPTCNLGICHRCGVCTEQD